MKEHLNNKFKSLSSHFAEWYDVMRDYYELVYENDVEYDFDSKYEQTTFKLHNIFETILNFFTRYGEFKDCWDFPARINFSRFGQWATVSSDKLNISFDFGFDYAYFFLNTYLRYPSNIKHMNDEFWSNFIALESLGHFNFLENSFPSSGDSEMAMKEFKNSKSNISRLIRNHIFFELFDGGSLDYGWLEIKWPISTAWDIIIKNGASAFKRFYRINYMLYRNEYLRIKMSKRTIAG